jgi:hypothetical protein
MKNQLIEAETHVKSLENGRKSASAKARSNLMRIKSQSHQLRKSVMEHTKTLPVKSRGKKKEVVAEAEAVVEAEVVEKPKRQRKKKVDQVEPVE